MLSERDVESERDPGKVGERILSGSVRNTLLPVAMAHLVYLAQSSFRPRCVSLSLCGAKVVWLKQPVAQCCPSGELKVKHMRHVTGDQPPENTLLSVLPCPGKPLQDSKQTLCVSFAYGYYKHQTPLVTNVKPIKM